PAEGQLRRIWAIPRRPSLLRGLLGLITSRLRLCPRSRHEASGDGADLLQSALNVSRGDRMFSAQGAVSDPTAQRRAAGNHCTPTSTEKEKCHAVAHFAIRCSCNRQQSSCAIAGSTVALAGAHRIEALVKKAAAIVDSKGKAALAEFRE